MNTTDNTTTRKAGRPVDSSKVHTLYLNQDGKPLGKGRRKAGATGIAVTVHRSINSLNYVHGTTPVVGQPVAYTVPAKANTGSVSVTVTEPVIPAADVIQEPAPAEAIAA